MNKRLETAQNKFIEGIGHMSDTFGLNSFIAKMYAYIYLNNRPLSLDEIAEALGGSKGNVCLNIRELEKWGAVRKVWIKGSRKDFYEAEMDIKNVFSKKIKSAIQRRISEIVNIIEQFNNAISSAEGDLTEEEKNLIKGYQERIKKIEELNNLISNMLRLMDNFL